MRHVKIYKRGRYWWVNYTTADGIRKRESLGVTNRLLAEERRIELETKIFKGELIGGSKRLSEFIPEYLAYANSNLRPLSARRYKQHVARIVEFLGDSEGIADIPLSKFTAPLIERYKQWRLNQGKMPKTVNDELDHLASFFSQAVKWKYLTVSPTKHVKRLRLPEVRPRWLTVEELAAVLDKCKPVVRPIFYFLASTGLRRNECAFLQWSDIDIAKKQIHIRNKDGFQTKGGENRTIPMTKGVKKLLEKLQHDSDYVFPYLQEIWNRRNGLLVEFKQAVKKAGIPDACVHDLRHTFASHLVQRGVSLFIVSNLLGHKSVETTQIYAHLAQERLADVVERNIPW